MTLEGSDPSGGDRHGLGEALASISCRGMLPSLVARGKESGKRSWESQDSGRGLRVSDPRGGTAAAACRKMGQHACSDHGTMRDRARWTPKRRI
ncbi:hypothetical protein CRG98_013070 [Punica granatum]|uniref:Uncharacterized protein n=1 Tax=Punica granatum TaxID=22663 RepID=A0A2I0KEC4_PUNGR|nr:hypothetical protein CRG98_013070 [Punica granatum]